MSRENTPPQPPPAETDPRFPSGPWVGFWLQHSYVGRQWMTLALTFRDGTVTGEGSDCVGEFFMHGTYDLSTGQCSILKSYQAAHSVTYDGRNDGDGMWIWGLWHIRNVDRGGFHLWPADQDDPTARRLRESKDLEYEPPRIKLDPVEVEAA